MLTLSGNYSGSVSGKAEKFQLIAIMGLVLDLDAIFRELGLSNVLIRQPARNNPDGKVGIERDACHLELTVPVVVSHPLQEPVQDALHLGPIVGSHPLFHVCEPILLGRVDKQQARSAVRVRCRKVTRNESAERVADEYDLLFWSYFFYEAKHLIRIVFCCLYKSVRNFIALAKTKSFYEAGAMFFADLRNDLPIGFFGKIPEGDSRIRVGRPLPTQA